MGTFSVLSTQFSVYLKLLYKENLLIKKKQHITIEAIPPEAIPPKAIHSANFYINNEQNGSFISWMVIMPKDNDDCRWSILTWQVLYWLQTLDIEYKESL